MQRISKVSFAITLALLPLAALAQEAGVTIPQPLGDVSVPVLAGRIVRNLLGILGTVALVMFIYGGFMYLTAAGNEEKVTKGKQTLIWATLGLIIVFFAYAIVNFVVTQLSA